MILSISNNNYILKVGDLIKFIKEIKYQSGLTIKTNSYYFIIEIWNETNGNIVLKNEDDIEFSLSPNYVDKILNYKQ